MTSHNFHLAYLTVIRGGSGNYEDPYRLHNSDVFEYEMDSPMTLYGAIPFMQAHRKDSTVGVFWLNAAETWVDIVKRKQSSNPLSLGIGAKTDTETHWFSESGLLDVFVFLGPTPKEVISQYSELTGYTQLPQQFAIGYHQCRWNYVTDEDVKDVDKKMDRGRIPYDVIWLDIEYTDGKKYFTWDAHTFPNPLGMQKQLDAHGRKLVAIIDPHIKNEGNYPVVEELKSKSLAVKDKDSNIYEGWCWPGSSHWVDCFNPAAVEWWRALFTYKSFTGTASNTFIWNDMNEPSVFNGPETTMPKDNMHYGNWEHRDVHNINGMTFVNATYNALLHRDPISPRRPFVLTRSYFSGSQRLGAMWTGDNQAEWSHLAASIPMILTHNIAGFPFAGADVGGFFGNPSKELLTRWYQAGAFYPFFRGHAHIDTRRREPYVAGEPYTAIITQALRLRYQLLPAWYTAFHSASVTGAPILRPHYYVHPSDEAAFATEDQFYLGATGLLVKPVVTEGADTVSIYLPPNEIYYDYFTYATHHGTGSAITLPAPLDKIPLLIRAGHIIPRKDRPRRSSALMRHDPYTLLIALGADGTATGELYIDDGESYDYQDGAYIHRSFTFASNTLHSVDVAGKAAKEKKRRDFLKTMAAVRVEKIVIVGAPGSWMGKRVVRVVEEGVGEREVEMRVHKGDGVQSSWAVVRDPGVGIGRGWSLEF
jgi:alpha 1,3-glucosidase